MQVVLNVKSVLPTHTNLTPGHLNVEHAACTRAQAWGLHLSTVAYVIQVTLAPLVGLVLHARLASTRTVLEMNHAKLVVSIRMQTLRRR